MSYLEPTTGDDRVNELRLWLSGSITRADYFTSTHHSLSDLHEALHEGVKEIDVILDQQLFQLIALARSATYNIELSDDAFFDGRKIDVEELRSMSIVERLGRRHTIRCLKLAQAEIEWQNHEIGRLQVHMNNAAEMITAKLRNKFSYHPLTRRIVDREPKQAQEGSSTDSSQETRAGTEEGEVLEGQDERESAEELEERFAERQDSAMMDTEMEMDIDTEEDEDDNDKEVLDEVKMK
ncbi:unnamed protein product [Zymoseptoria tritici ST99CH_1E4]|uniref:Uncharacterized protein n=1 Tax=Zymoseptoria tritici ST99CH_1E4 TaxID=1276532 RepID=A0A2H1FZV8_ZYMTR|nr:unnamed protein product [Zymoseptoria tritici ST99CH_1E4]